MKQVAPDMRVCLRSADAFVRDGRWSEALVLYESAADTFDRSGLALKAIAISRQIVAITTELAPDFALERLQALRRLERLYTQLALTAEALEVQRLLRESPAARRH